MVETSSTSVSEASSVAESADAESAAEKKKAGWVPPGQEKCEVCEKTVYVVERLEADKLVYHKVGWLWCSLAELCFACRVFCLMSNIFSHPYFFSAEMLQVQAVQQDLGPRQLCCCQGRAVLQASL